MQEINKKLALGATAAAIAAVGGVGIAGAKTKHPAHQAATTTTTSTTPADGHRGPSNETELTGDTATKAKDAALAAVPGGTVSRASTEDPAENTGAAYEVKVTKADGSRVEVLEDSAFKVLSTTADTHGRGGHDGHDGGRAELTGDTATKAKDAALAAVPGGTVVRAHAEDGDDASGAAYEVEVKKADGSFVEVLEDSSFKVLSTNADTHGPGHHHGRGH